MESDERSIAWADVIIPPGRRIPHEWEVEIDWISVKGPALGQGGNVGQGTTVGQRGGGTVLGGPMAVLVDTGTKHLVLPEGMVDDYCRTVLKSGTYELYKDHYRTKCRDVWSVRTRADLVISVGGHAFTIPSSSLWEPDSMDDWCSLLIAREGGDA